jgi:hypothetical protein
MTQKFCFLSHELKKLKLKKSIQGMISICLLQIAFEQEVCKNKHYYFICQFKTEKHIMIYLIFFTIHEKAKYSNTIILLIKVF